MSISLLLLWGWSLLDCLGRDLFELSVAQVESLGGAVLLLGILTLRKRLLAEPLADRVLDGALPFPLQLGSLFQEENAGAGSP